MPRLQPLSNSALRLFLFLALLSTIVISVPNQTARATIITVTNTNDSGSGSLRQAVGDAISGDTITFDPALAGGVITLVSEIVVNKDLTIDGSGLSSPLEISGNNSVRVFNINLGVQVAMDTFDLTNGYGDDGGAIYNEGTLTISNSTFSDNTASDSGAGIRNQDGTLTIINGTFSNNTTTGYGTAISNWYGTATISNSSFTNNIADEGGSCLPVSGMSGGGIHNQGMLTISDSTFSNNSSCLSGGGIANGSIGTANISNTTFSGNDSTWGGGIYNDGLMTVTNSTFAANTGWRGGGIAHSDPNPGGSMTISGATFSFNSVNGFDGEGGGLFNNTTTLHLENSILANSTDGLDCDTTVPLATNTNNLIEIGNCGTALTDDPMLSPLADNGGFTQTFALTVGSPAIDAGDDTACETTDQRSVARPQGLHCDIGAYESALQLTVNALTDLGDGPCDNDECTLREAATTIFSGGTINFDSALAGGTIELTDQITLNKDVSIDAANLDSRIKISGGGTHRVFQFYGIGLNQTSVELANIEIRNGNAANGGGVECSNCELTISQGIFHNNLASNDGAGLYNHSGGSVNIFDSTFTANNASDSGGGIFNDDTSTLMVVNTAFSNNWSNWWGSGIYNDQGTAVISNTTMTTNVSQGGTIYNATGSMTVSNSTIAGNSSTYGGGILSTGALHLLNSILAGNTGGDQCNSTGSMPTNTNNLIEDGSCSPALTGSPLLDTLADNGGLTWTMALLVGSPAIDAGDDETCESTNQRGLARPQGEDCDIGAYEKATQMVVNALQDPGTGACDVSECTLREAVATVAENGLITFDPSLTGGEIGLGSEITIGKPLSIDGSGLSAHVRISGGGIGQNFVITGPVTVTFNHLDIINGFGESGAGIENNQGTVTVTNSTVSGHLADTGGALNNNNGVMVIRDSTITGNSATTYGGAINNNLGSLSISGTTLSGNTTDNFGGGIFNNVGIVTITNSTFYSNTAGYGGGIENWEGTLTINNSTFSGNSATTEGGALWNSALSTLFLSNSILADSLDGGDCYNDGSVTNINNLVEDGTCGAAISGDPLLGPLGDNGGSTWTIALLISSPAIDAGHDATCEPTDQRGVTRPVGAHCDLGAFEVEFPYFVFLPTIKR